MTTFETFTTETRRPTRNRIAAVVVHLAATAVARVRVWHNRRQVARLLGWDAHMLRDIGLTPGDVTSALAVRADEDASVQLSMLSLERRYAAKAQARERLAHGAELRAGGARYRVKR